MAYQIRPLVKIFYGRVNEPVRVPIDSLLLENINTFLTVDTSSAVVGLNVKNITGFTTNQILLLGEAGNQGTEIVKTSSITSATAGFVTLAATTVFPHSASTPVNVINFDQIVFASAATLTGTKTNLATTAIAGAQLETFYNDTAGTTGYYFARFYNTISATYSPYSDGVPVGGYGVNTARAIIDSALSEINKTTSDVLTDEFFFQQLNNFQNEVQKELKRWSWLQKFSQKIGTTSIAGWKIAVPTDLDDQNTNKSIYNFLVGTGTPLTWVDKERFEILTQNVANTTLATNLIVGASTVTLTDSANFDSSGSIQVGASSLAFTANNSATGVLTLTSVSTTTAIAGVDVFQGASTGTPQYWTTYGGYLYHYPIIDTQLAGRDYLLDYYSILTVITTDADTIVVPDITCAQYYLQWKALKKINNGTENQGSQGAMSQYLARRQKLIQKEVLGKTFVLKPRYNDWGNLMSSNIDGSTRHTRTGNFPNTGF